MNIDITIQPIARKNGETRSETEKRFVGLALRRLFPGKDVTIEHNPDGSPFLPDFPETVITISHSMALVAVAVATAPVGIDIEKNREQLKRVAGRVLDRRELSVASAMPRGLLKAWTAKEAVYKAALTPGVNFAEDIILSDDFSTARFKDGTVYHLFYHDGLPDDNLLAVATTSEICDIKIH